MSDRGKHEVFGSQSGSQWHPREREPTESGGAELVFTTSSGTLDGLTVDGDLDLTQTSVPPSRFQEPVLGPRAKVAPVLSSVPTRFTVPPVRLNVPNPAVHRGSGIDGNSRPDAEPHRTKPRSFLLARRRYSAARPVLQDPVESARCDSGGSVVHLKQHLVQVATGLHADRHGNRTSGPDRDRKRRAARTPGRELARLVPRLVRRRLLSNNRQVVHQHAHDENRRFDGQEETQNGLRLHNRAPLLTQPFAGCLALHINCKAAWQQPGRFISSGSTDG
jgi:hypothetical protein